MKIFVLEILGEHCECGYGVQTFYVDSIHKNKETAINKAKSLFLNKDYDYRISEHILKNTGIEI